MTSVVGDHHRHEAAAKRSATPVRPAATLARARSGRPRRSVRGAAFIAFKGKQDRHRDSPVRSQATSDPPPTVVLTRPGPTRRSSDDQAAVARPSESEGYWQIQLIQNPESAARETRHRRTLPTTTEPPIRSQVGCSGVAGTARRCGWRLRGLRVFTSSVPGCWKEYARVGGVRGRSARRRARDQLLDPSGDH